MTMPVMIIIIRCDQMIIEAHVNPCPAKLSNFNFNPVEVVSRYRDPQLQLCENYSYLFILMPIICNY